ncbi:Lrp/AsnC family transcriptional regulator [Streptomyces sp. H34-S4]|uniref:Lrp/AsnC family transcriptional regulator n=1 Tax=Streptomyces sp. H34-S4 TaxID=2996463 RepID=UPI002270DAC0|nr:Lrp/AsnC ligand binding domain-containing protein [Streptomyces sp. H34-S4]MCY0933491.1 Lrp/AsnC ligand binding domain-containing protein [Streptomyces sp. H34-S4]
MYLDVEIVPQTLGYEAETPLTLTASRARIAEVGAAIGSHPEVPFAAVVTGSANILAVVVCRDADALYTYLTERIGAVPGIHQVTPPPPKRRGLLAMPCWRCDGPARPVAR